MFEINKDAKVTTFKDINGRSAIIVDDVYKDPDEVRELALSLDYGDGEAAKGGFPGIRSGSHFRIPEVKGKLYNLYLDLCSNKLWKRPFNLEDFNSNWDIQGFMVNATKDTFLKQNFFGMIPHQDYWEDLPSENPKLQFGSVIYLNTPEECAGGTNLYSYNGEMSISSEEKPEWLQRHADIVDIKGPVLTSMSEEKKFKYLKDIIDGDTLYKTEFEAEMKYNRMFLYQADVLHSMEVDIGMFRNNHRLVQILFM